MSFNSAIFLTLFLHLIFSCLLKSSLINAHTFLLNPEPFYKRYETKSCTPESCNWACPQYPPPKGRTLNNDIDNPGAVWSRGQYTTIDWAKNNHNGGFVMFSMVPVSKDFMNKQVHKDHALYFGCWEQGVTPCVGGEPCGTGDEHLSRNFRVPECLPDGMYVFGYVWYGGIQYERDIGQFPDYHSCVFVQVSGGVPLGDCRPFYEPGDTGRYQNGNKCYSSIDEPGPCTKTGCTTPVVADIPKPFKSLPDTEGSPLYLDPLSPSHFGSSSATSVPTTTPFVKPTPSQSTQFVPPAAATQSPSGSPNIATQTPLPSSSSPMFVPATPTSSPLGNPPNFDYGICENGVCCASSCGSCDTRDQYDCHNRPGGTYNCCPQYIFYDGKPCGVHPAPCVYNAWG